MQFTCDAIVLSTNKYGENSGIACILTEERGVYKGLVRGITGVKQRGLYQPGNIIEATWRARLEEQLGSLSAGLIHSYAAAVMDNPIKLAAISSLCAILDATMQERDALPTIYRSFKLFLEKLVSESFIGKSKIANLPDEAANDLTWEKIYISLELELLEQLGFGLDLTSCAATGTTEDLIYVSPKSGRAVSRFAGQPYHNKLLKLPYFLLGKSRSSLTKIDTYAEVSGINDGMALCGYFFDKYFFTPHNIRQPQARARFAEMLKAKC